MYHITFTNLTKGLKPKLKTITDNSLKPSNISRKSNLVEGKVKFIKQFIAELNQEVDSLNKLKRESLHDFDEYELNEVADKIKHLKENDYNRQKNGLLANGMNKTKSLYGICNRHGYYPEVPIQSINQIKEMNNETLVKYLKFFELKYYVDNTVLNKVKLLAWLGIMEYGAGAFQ